MKRINNPWIRVVGITSVVLLSTGCASTTEIKSGSENFGEKRQIQLTESEQMALAGNAYREKRYSRAIDLYQSVLISNTNNHKATLNLSAVYLDLALQGFKHVGGLIADKTATDKARAHYNEITLQAKAFLEHARPVVTN